MKLLSYPTKPLAGLTLPCRLRFTHDAGQGYREATDEAKIPWQLDVLAWDNYHGILIPSSSTVTWADEGTSWLVVNIDDVTYNVDVNDYIRAKGP